MAVAGTTPEDQPSSVHCRDWTKRSRRGHAARADAPAGLNANAFHESWIGPLKRECLNHFVCFNLAYRDHILRGGPIKITATLTRESGTADILDL
ncbi:hypothetical protein RAS1_14960 [Phycisphaerae bacterium RAS1]|nr:hypothetical protein RAS1_14960 [Phycisphaerae bacterium RAS1]